MDENLWTRAELEADAKALQAELALYSARALVAGALQFEAAKEGAKNEREALVAIVEYLALLLHDRIRVGGGAIPPFAVIESTVERAYTILSKLYALVAVDAQGNTDDDTFSTRFRTSGLVIRIPGVPEHYTTLLRSFATDFDPHIERGLGFSLNNALDIIDGIQQTLIARMHVHRQAMYKRAADVWAIYRKKQSPKDAELRDLFQTIRERRWPPKRAILSHYFCESMTDAEQLAYVYIDEVANHARIDASVVRRFCELFALDPNTRPEWLVLPSSYNALAKTPIIQTDDGRSFVPYVPLLLWSLIPRVEDLLNRESGKAAVSDRAHWLAYESRRKQFLEQTAARLLSKNPLTRAKTNVPFTVEGIPYEIDVVAEFDSTTYVVECKAMTVDDATRRGAPLSLAHDLARVLRDASEQLDRGIQYLKSQATDASHEYIPLIVTLDDTSAIAAGTPIKEYLELSAGVYPWMISLVELYTLADLLETPYQFKHYARSRLRAVREQRDVFAHDELDFYQNYLYFKACALPPDARHVVVAPSDDVDRYYAPRAGTKKPKKPAPGIPPNVRTVIEHLERENALGWSDAVCDLLDLSPSASRHLDERIARTRAKTKPGHTGTVRLRVLEDTYGIIYVVTDDLESSTTIPMVQFQLREFPDEVTYLLILDCPRRKRAVARVYTAHGKQWRRLHEHALFIGEKGLLIRNSVRLPAGS